MKPTSIAVVGPRARDIGEQMERDGAFAVVADADSFTQLLRDDRFPTRYVVVEEAPDPDRTRARVAILRSLGAKVILVRRTDLAAHSGDADLVLDPSPAPGVLEALGAAENERRQRARVRARQRPLTPITPREREAVELWKDTGRIPEVALRLGVGYTTAATLIKRARKKLADRLDAP